MLIEVKRDHKFNTYTIGHVYIDGVYFCDSIEDAVRSMKDINGDGDAVDAGEGKIWGQTAIPAGQYTLAKYYWPKVKRFVPLLLQVPFFQGILIHAGSSEVNSSGCLIFGYNEVKGKVINSLAVNIELMKKLEIAWKNNEPTYILITE